MSIFSIVIDQEEKAAEKILDLASPSDVTKVVFIDASYMLVCGSIVSLIQYSKKEVCVENTLTGNYKERKSASSNQAFHFQV